MFKSVYIIVISLIFLTVASAESRSLGYKCNANGKRIIARYSYWENDGYILNSLTIDGKDYKSTTKLSVSRSSAKFIIENFRDGKRLVLKMGIENAYQLGKDGKVYQMLCYPIRFSGNQHSDDQL